MGHYTSVCLMGHGIGVRFEPWTVIKMPGPSQLPANTGLPHKSDCGKALHWQSIQHIVLQQAYKGMPMHSQRSQSLKATRSVSALVSTSGAMQGMFEVGSRTATLAPSFIHSAI